MYIIIGNSPKRVELKDLGDCVYYKQQKVFTDRQYEKSNDLKSAIERKDLLILRKIEEIKDTSDYPVEVTTGVSLDPTSDISSKIDILLEKIYKLEKIVESKTPQDVNLFSDLLSRIEKIEKNLTNIDFSSFKKALMEKKEDINSNKDIESITKEIIDRLENVITQKIDGTKNDNKELEQKSEEVYVPNIIVEDANSNIKLEVRTIENSDNISESLKKLKELKSKSK